MRTGRRYDVPKGEYINDQKGPDEQKRALRNLYFGLRVNPENPSTIRLNCSIISKFKAGRQTVYAAKVIYFPIRLDTVWPLVHVPVFHSFALALVV